MGITRLVKELEICLEYKSLEDLKDSIAAIDVSIWYCQANSLGVSVTAYLDVRISQLREQNIEPIIVMDGEIPTLKLETIQRRRLLRSKRQRQKNHDSTEPIETIEDEDESFDSWDLRGEDYESNVISFCEKRNIPYIVSPYEADSQITWLVKSGIADFAISEDSDLIVFGCPKILFKFKNKAGMMFDSESMAEYLGERFSYSKLMSLSILVGCDYLPGGLPGFGVVKLWDCYNKFKNDNISLAEIEKDVKSDFKLSMTDEFKTRYMLAAAMFRHQIIIHPITGIKQPLNAYQNDDSCSDGGSNCDDKGQKGAVWFPNQAVSVNPSAANGSILSFECRFCKSTFHNIYERGIHIDNHHKVLCEICGDLVLQDKINNHMNKLHGQLNVHRCFVDGCFKQFSTAAYLKKHTEFIHEPTIYVCEYCHKDFRREMSLKSHVRAYHLDVALICKECGRVFPTSDLLLQHEKIHIYTATFKCDRCPKGFETAEKLQEHQANRHDKKYICTFCYLSFDKNGDLNAHISRIHCERMHVCDVCEEAFKTKQALRTHMSAKHLKTLVKCDLCEKSFAIQAYLQRHKLRCHNNTVFNCDVCGSTFQSIQGFMKHKLSHTRIIKCDICGKTFTENHSRKQHIQNVHNKQKYQCMECGKYLSSATNLRRHIAGVHSIVLVECPQCKRQFKSVNLSDHIRSVHPKKRFYCEICNDSFKTSTNLKLHKAAKHEMVNQRSTEEAVTTS